MRLFYNHELYLFSFCVKDMDKELTTQNQSQGKILSKGEVINIGCNLIIFPQISR